MLVFGVYELSEVWEYCEIWDWDFIDTHETWITTRLKANLLLDKLNIKSRTYNDDFTTIYDVKGNIIKKTKM